jgi:hypothetical protein
MAERRWYRKLLQKGARLQLEMEVDKRGGSDLGGRILEKHRVEEARRRNIVEEEDTGAQNDILNSRSSDHFHNPSRGLCSVNTD